MKTGPTEPRSTVLTEAEEAAIVAFRRHILLPLNDCLYALQHRSRTSHLADFVTGYNYARRLKTLNGLTPYEYICKIWTSERDRFMLDPIHQMPGLNT